MIINTLFLIINNEKRKKQKKKKPSNKKKFYNIKPNKKNKTSSINTNENNDNNIYTITLYLKALNISTGDGTDTDNSISSLDNNIDYKIKAYNLFVYMIMILKHAYVVMIVLLRKKVIKYSEKYNGIKFCIKVNIISHFSLSSFQIKSDKIHATTHTLLMFNIFETAKNQILDHYEKIIDKNYFHYNIHSLKVKIYELRELYEQIWK